MIGKIKSLMGLSDTYTCTGRGHVTSSAHGGPGEFYVQETCPNCGLVEKYISCKTWYKFLTESGDRVHCGSCGHSGRPYHWDPTLLADLREGK